MLVQRECAEETSNSLLRRSLSNLLYHRLANKHRRTRKWDLISAYLTSTSSYHIYNAQTYNFLRDTAIHSSIRLPPPRLLLPRTTSPPLSQTPLSLHPLTRASSPCTSTNALLLATSAAVSPFPSSTAGSAPRSSRSLTIEACPAAAAATRGGRQNRSRSPIAAAAARDADEEGSAASDGVDPGWRCAGVWRRGGRGVIGRRLGRRFMSAPRSRRTSAVSRRPREQARVSAVCPVTFDS